MTEKFEIVRAPYWQCKYLVHQMYNTFTEPIYCLFCAKINGFCFRTEYCSDFEPIKPLADPMEVFLLKLELLNEAIMMDLKKAIRW